ncbi:hypothetical protein GQ53DRAFT_803939 [Thozetella sp. PMI_491]|nr:hypothetical protein GQ53DRAFT_803939 [Thozetella sp. PMI_491]
MSADAYFFDDSLDDIPSDVAKLWEQALKNYQDKSGFNLSATGRDKWSMSTIKAEQTRLLKSFEDFRHPGTWLDRLRGVVGRNTDIITSVASHISTAASGAFPPAAGIVTAFNYCLNSGSIVSQDYDMIIAFFDIVNSFLERLDLLESRLPTLHSYQSFLINVFCALLDVCAVAQKYRTDDHGRFRKWAHALVTGGGDNKLKTAFVTLNTCLQRLESATLMMTLRTAIDTSNTVNIVDTKVDRLLVIEEENWAMTSQGLRMTQEMKLITTDSNSTLKEMRQEMRKEFAMMHHQSAKVDKGKTVTDVGDASSTALRRVKEELGGNVLTKNQFNELRLAYIPDTLAWLTAEDGFRAICADESKLWWIVGAPGMGKSVLAYKLVTELQREFGPSESTFISYFFFRDDRRGLDSIHAMMRWCAVQIAEQDNGYRQDILTELQRGALNRRWDVKTLWTSLFLDRFKNDSKRRLILVLDGIDQVDEKDGRRQLHETIAQAAMSDFKIQIVFTSDPSYEMGIGDVKYHRLELCREKLAADMKKMAMGRIKQLPRLKGLSRGLHGKVTAQVSSKADSMAYIEHILRRLNALGREGLIIKEIAKAPGSTNELYETLLRECCKRRTGAGLEYLKHFFTWIAYSKAPLRLPQLTNIMERVANDSEFNIDDELEHRSAIFLKVFSSKFNDDEEDDAGDEKLGEEDEGDEAAEIRNRLADLHILVGFHDRSLKLFFQQTEAPNHQLRCLPSIGNLIIFKDIISTLTRDGDLNATYDRLEALGINYAAKFWKQHLQDIDKNSLKKDEIAQVIQGLDDFLSNKGRAFSKIRLPFDFHSILGEGKDETEVAVDLLAKWIGYGPSLSTQNFPPDTLERMEHIIKDKQYIYVLLARGHINSWFNSETQWGAALDFSLAYAALKEARNLLPDNSQIQQLFQSHNMSHTKFPIQAFMLLSEVFPDIPKPLKACQAIGAAMRGYGFDEESVDLLKSCLNKTPSMLELFQLHADLGNALFAMDDNETFNAKANRQKSAQGGEEEKATKEAKKRARRIEALEHFNKAIEVFPKRRLTHSPKDLQLFFLLRKVHQRRLKIEIELGHNHMIVDHISQYFAQATLSPTNIPLSGEFFDAASVLGQNKQWSQIIQITKMLAGKDRRRFIMQTETNSGGFEHAAVVCNEVEYAFHVLDEAIGGLRPTDYGIARLLIRKALLHSTALRSPDDLFKAKELLNQTLGLERVFLEDFTRASFALADILLQEFRAARVVEAKMAAFDEMRILVARMADMSGKGFDPDRSQLSIPLAHMTCRLGTPPEYEAGLQAVFDGCLEALNDGFGWNDSASFRMLAKVLACVGLERHASVAATCQLYIVNMEIWKMDQGREQDELGMSDEDSSDDEEDSASNKSDGKEEDLDPGSFLFCGDCNKEFWDWNEPEGSLYLCYFCTDLSLCQECFEKKTAVDNGERGPEWRTLCPKGHKHIKAPVEGWRGLKNGVLKMNVEITFDDWLKDVKHEWGAKWDQYWAEDT